MLLNQFPNISWLKLTAETNFNKQLDAYQRPLKHEGWPNVILHTTATATERKGIKGPFSLFFNLHGHSHVKAGGRHLKVGTDRFALTNAGQYYDLILPEKQETTTFNIHFGEYLYKEVGTTCTQSHHKQLDNGSNVQDVTTHAVVRTYFIDPVFKNSIQKLQNACVNSTDYTDQIEEVLLTDLLVHLLKITQKNLKGLGQISSLKKTTREELFNRLLRSIEYIHDEYASPLTIEALSTVSCLSKFHFLRTFKEAFGCTPVQYWQWIRLQKAQEMLENSAIPVHEIAMIVGFTEVNSFIRFFKQQLGQPPGAFRRDRN